MAISRKSAPIFVAALLGVGLTAAVPARAQNGQTPLATNQPPLPPEVNPPGDIPDTQVFVEYQSPLGFSIKAPEGWARRTGPNGVTFTARYDSVAVEVTAAATAPTAAAVKHTQVSALKRQPAAVRVSKITTTDLPGGPAVMIAYGSNSARNPVTNKAIRLENARYLFWKNGRLATLILSAPFGADNADQWRLMARSFRWQ